MTQNELLELIESLKKVKCEDLDLTDEGLQSLPTEMWNLKNLKRLRLGGNQLKEISREIAKLSSLEWLDLYNNELVEIPIGILQLSNLQILLLSNNRINTIPDSIFRLQKLRVLDLSRNCLTNIPNPESHFSHLEWFDLSHNQLNKLPDAISELSELRTLDLSNNRLTEIPRAIGELSNLGEFDIRGNVLSDIPIEILDDYCNARKILDYYFRQQREEKRPLNEAKVILVGEGAVGKTSLVKRLVDNTFNPSQTKTEGIDIRTWDIQTNSETVKLNLWDFGGQEIMHATHQFFLTERSLYLLVINNRVNELTNQIDRWLKLIDSFGKDSPILIIGNYADFHPLDLNRTGWQTKYPNIKGFFQTSCQTGDGISELREAIRGQIGIMESVFYPTPQSYFNVKAQLEEAARGGMKYIPYTDYEKICTENGIDNLDEHRFLAKTLHNLGIALNFIDDHRDTIRATHVLNPHWIVEGVYKILNNNPLMTINKGVLHWEDLQDIFAPPVGINNFGYLTSKERQFVIDMMEKFELCFQFYQPNTLQYLIPDLLPKEEPDTGTWENSLNFEYHYSVLPQSIISRFIVRMHRNISKNTYWRTGTVLILENCRALIRADLDDAKIFISISGSRNNRLLALSIIRNTFSDIHATISALTFDERIPLFDKPTVTTSYNHLLKLEDCHGKNYFYFPENADHEYNVTQLLEGIETIDRRLETSDKHQSNQYSQKSIPIVNNVIIQNNPYSVMPQKTSSSRSRSPKDPDTERPIGLLISVVVYLLIFGAIAFAIAYVEKWWMLPLAIVGSILAFSVILTFHQLSNRNISEKGFLSLMFENLKRLTLIQTLTDSMLDFAKSSKNSKNNPKKRNRNGDHEETD